MKGMRPLTNDEILKVSECFDGTYAVRNRSLFMIGVSCGGRISELLSLKIDDVWQNTSPVTDIYFTKYMVKGKKHARAVPLNLDGREAISDLIDWYGKQKGHYILSCAPLFQSRKGIDSLSAAAADKMLKKAFQKAGLNGNLATHSMRKSYAQRLHDMTKNILAVKEMLGHQSVATTEKYLSVNYIEVREASEMMAVSNDKKDANMTPLCRANDDEIVIELLSRGYSVKKENNVKQDSSETHAGEHTTC